MTPEIARCRATPGSAQVKRKNCGPQNTPESARRRRHTVSLDDCSSQQCGHESPSLSTPLQRLMMNRRGSIASSSANTPKNTKKRRDGKGALTNKDSKQRTIIDMLNSPKFNQEGCEMLEGVKQLDISQNKRESGLLSNSLEKNPEASRE